MNGKGDKRRPSSVSKEQFDENWDKIFGSKYSSEPLPDFDWTQAYDWGSPSRDGSHLTDEERERMRELREQYMPTDMWAFPPKDKPKVPKVDEGVNLLREVNYDNMWKHSCTVEMAVVWTGENEPCSYCGAWEEDGDEPPASPNW